MRTLFIVLLFICSFFTGRAQFYQYGYGDYDRNITAHFGLSGGLMNAITDLGGKSNVFATFRIQGGFYVAVMYQNTIGARLETTWGSIEAADSNSAQKGVRQRNFSFSSDIAEISLIGELHPLNLLPNFEFPVSPYLLGGVGSFSFNPKTKFNGRDIFLQPLHTEGQGFPETGRTNYKLSQIMIPVGGGLSYQISPLFTVKGELIYRLLNTDYLDDVSTTYIDPALFDKNLTPVTASLAKELFYRNDEKNGGNITPPSPGTPRGSRAKDGYYSLNLKLQLTLGKQ